MKNEQTARADVIQAVLDIAGTRLSGDRLAPVVDFIPHLLRDVPIDDLLAEDVETLFGAAVDLWEFLASRKPGEPRVRVHNPNFEEHGWHCEHTVVEVATDDAPFLVDSLTAALSRGGAVVHLVIHPVLWVRRDATGALIGLVDKGGRGGSGVARESLMQLRITQQTDAAGLAALKETTRATLERVRLAVRDWQAMRDRCAELADGLDDRCAVASTDEVAEVREFLYWLREDHYTFLGYREYEIDAEKESVALTDGRGLGILADERETVFDRLRDLSALPEGVGDYLNQPKLLFVNKSSHRSPVHRPVHMDVVAVRRFDAAGTLTGLALFVGLFTLDVYTNSPSGVPVLRAKIARVLDAAGYDPHGHDGKRMMNILENLPRDELFQTSTRDLMITAQGILHLQDRRRCAIFARIDQFKRFVSALVFVPRDRFDSHLRKRIEAAIAEAYNGEPVDYYTQVSDSPLARVQFIVKIGPDARLDADAKTLERRIADLARSWGDHLQEVMVKAFGEAAGLRRFHVYGDAFPTSYVETFPTDAAIRDIDQIDRVLDTGRLGLSLYHPLGGDPGHVRFKIYHADAAVPLSDILPMLENMGFKVIGEVPYEIRLKALGRAVWIHDFEMTAASGGDIDLSALRSRFEDAFIRLWDGQVENDGFNRLVVTAGLDWREAALIRAYARYLRQIGYPFSQDYVIDVLTANPAVTRRLVDLFRIRFDPDRTEDRAARGEALDATITADLDAVVNADEDRILRTYLDLIRNSLRTNFFQVDGDGAPPPHICFKIDSRGLAELPAPRPMVEIFISSPRVEGIHLRGGRVARGGIRWSDRREDFRTEILGLLKAQMVKNAVIVPVGSKGGFVVKQPPADPSREAQLAEGIACYRIFIGALLDLTDNLSGDVVIPPERVVRRDGDDPYLVVAADKGTATFSDIANEISLSRGFWLGDAFASGGSNGYDHKAMGITARGAWESIKRHFREMGRDTQSQDFTVVGVGDMSGDVFGNGMLLSPHIRLIGAFNHMHIFIDPDPDPQRAFDERKRLFETPRSTWADYAPDLISAGGGVFERRAKTIKPTPQIKALFGLSGDAIPPNELIKAMLKAEVDLLWFGGIGTYIKSAEESNAEVGDRANDAVRVNGADLRAKVVGEGANLGVTQRGRIEFALKGGRINTDAIDNSGGVDCSDHEVNIKILLNALVVAGDMTGKQRNKLLAEMTEEVGSHVLKDNYLQTQALSMVQAHGVTVLDQQDRLMRLLEKSGRLDRGLEYLPDDETLAERFTSRKGLTRPELAVLMPYSKMWLFDEIMDSDLPDEALLVEELIRYFPTPLRKPHREAILKHRLKREIIATVTTNSIINRVGGTFITQMTERTGLKAVDVARAYLIAREAFGLRAAWSAIAAIDAAIPAGAQTAMLAETNRLIDRAVLWLLRAGPHPLDLKTTIARLGTGVAALRDNLATILTEDTKALLDGHAREFTAQGVPEDLAARVSGLIVLASAFDVVRVAEKRKLPVQDIAPVYFAVGTRFGLGWLRAAAERIGEGSHWQKLAIGAVIEEFYSHQRDLADAILAATAADQSVEERIAAWSGTHAQTVERADQLIAELQAAPEVDLAMLTVASRQFRAMTQG